jgi:nucleotide-binding universal stress UspA family protein
LPADGSSPANQALVKRMGGGAMTSSFQTIVVAVDFSETSEEAWTVAGRLALATGAHLHLLHVTGDPLHQPWAVETIAVDFDGIVEEWRGQARERLATMRAAPGLDERRITRAVVTGVPHLAIAEYALAQHADLIVVGTHGHGPLKHLLLGSVAERVVRHAECPVMTVPPPALVAQRTPRHATRATA